MQDLIKQTAEIIKPGSVAFMKLRDGADEKLIACRVLEFDGTQGDVNTSGAVFESRYFTPGVSAAIEPGAGAAVYHLADGVLYTMMATVVGSEVEQAQRIRLLLPNQCRGRSLRSNQRYAVLGSFTLFPADPLMRYIQEAPVPLSISLGGFGLQIRNVAVEPEQPVDFELRVMVDEGGQASTFAPVLDLSGTAEARYIMVLDDAANTYCGFRFIELADDALGSLAFWIRTHEALLRSA